MTRLLNSQIYGEVTAQPALLIVPGLFGAGRNWRAIAKRLCCDRQVITVDMRNHAGSFWDAGHSYDDLADDLAGVLAQFNGPVDVMGHSMGGKAAMVLALRNPVNMNRLIVVDIAPVGYSHSQMSNITAMQDLDISTIARRSEVENLLATKIKDGPTRAFLAQSLDLSGNGNRWVLNLDALARNMDHIIGFPDISGRFCNAALFIKGGASDYILPRFMAKIKTLFPNAVLREVPGAGHWVHAEAPRAFIDVVTDFLRS